ncbi:hypothetical protein LN650_24905 [Klebsiella pneumoniae subsp. pneumoniae]|nr:hypothetical protein [Klebsiella pneumoniae subsp. pneumoniae]
MLLKINDLSICAFKIKSAAKNGGASSNAIFLLAKLAE